MVHPLWTIPNILSFTRLPLAVGLFVSIDDNLWAVAFGLFLLGSFTDWLDGWWARRFGPLTPLGRTLDPLTDKVFVACAFIALLKVPEANLQDWMVAVILGRELFITGVRGYVETIGLKFGADWLGKAKMFLQSLWIGTVLGILSLSLVLGEGDFLSWCRNAQAILLLAMLVATIVSGIQYVIKAERLIRRGSRSESSK